MAMLHPSARTLWSASWVIGLGLGAFVDGIVFHQILRWHHLASDVTGRSDDLGWQVMLDGLFHALAFLLVVTGLFLLHRAWRRHPDQQDARVLFGGVIFGWGVFNLLDGVVSHHVLGLHHTWPDGPGGPLAWDLGFLASGVLLLIGGILMARRAAPRDDVPRMP